MYSYNLMNSLQFLTAINYFSLTLILIPTNTWRCVHLPNYHAQNCPYVAVCSERMGIQQHQFSSPSQNSLNSAYECSHFGCARLVPVRR